MIPIPSSIRAALAASAIFLFLLGAVLYANNAPRGWWVPGLFSGILMFAAMFGGSPPTADDEPRIAEQLSRFRTAMIGCFIAAFALLILGAVRLLPTEELVHSAVSLGSAFWFVAVVLAAFVYYYRMQLRLARRT